jgi:hypothetical protein
MKKINLLSLVALFAIVLFSVSCNKDDDHNHDDHDHDAKGSVGVSFNYVWGSSAAPFALNTPLTHPRTSEVLTFTTVKFYVSNLKLKDMDGNWWIHPESYFLVDAFSEARSTFTLNDVPAKHYVEMEYTLGVDSTRNVSGAQTGALDPQNGMFWSWNTGYIMFKFEGSEATEGTFSYHLGGFSGANNIVTAKTTDFGGVHLMVEKDAVATVNMVANPARLWHTIDGIAERSTIHMPGANAKQAADDFIVSVNFAN